jgi:hypothetical protein
MPAVQLVGDRSCGIWMWTEMVLVIIRGEDKQNENTIPQSDK